MKEIIWKGPDSYYYQKSPTWYIFVSLFFLSILIWAAVHKDFIFIVFIILSYTTIIYVSKRKPKLITFKIDEQGICIGNKKYKFSNLKSFYILKGEKRNLLIVRKKTLGNQITLPIKKSIVEHIEKALSSKIKEEEMEEPWIDKFIRKIGF